MENINRQMQASGFGVAVKASGPDTNYGLGQCYEDLSLLDCELCYAEERTVIPQCYPYNSGRIYLDGCFMRYENYSFFQEYTRPGDRAVFGNTTRKNPTFEEPNVWRISETGFESCNCGCTTPKRPCNSSGGCAWGSEWVSLCNGGLLDDFECKFLVEHVDFECKFLVEYVWRMRQLQYWNACLSQRGKHLTLAASWGTQTKISSTRD